MLLLRRGGSYRDAGDHAALADLVDDAPVRERRDGEPRDRRERRLVLERMREDLGRVAQEREPAVRELRLRARASLRLEEPHCSIASATRSATS